MHFQTPLALLLLLLLIPIIRIGRPSRGYGRGREVMALGLRVAIVTLLVLAAAGPELRRGSDALAVVYLVDVSDSMPPESAEAAYAFIDQALKEMRPQDQAAVILFGDEALVERPMSGERELHSFTSIPNTTGSDLAEAVRLAMALYPPETGRRMVLLSDGRQTTGDAAAAARLAVRAGVEFIVVPLSEAGGEAEVTLLDVDLPSRLIAGEAFDLSFRVHSRRQTTVIARVLAAGEVVFEGAADLEPGTQTFRIPLIAGDSGFTPYVVQIAAAEDAHYQNNKLAAYTQVSGPPKVLVVAPPEGEPLPYSGAPRPDESSALVRALEEAGFTIDLTQPSGLPFELSLLGEYASIVLVDVPARDLSARQMNALQSYVRDLGGGLLVVGGPTSYGVGGYFRTPLEETLPVEMEIKDQERRPGLTMVFIIDHSGSMASTNSGVTKLDLAKEAAIRSVELLFPGDKIGVIAFDDAAGWVVPITDLSDPDPIVAAIETIGIGGGTDILAGLQAMAEELPQDDSRVKHVILLTDGGASEAGIPELVQDLFQQYGITLTTVGIGSDSAPFLKDIAILGGGRYHFTDRPESIPNIFTEETSLATRSYIVEESFFPALAGRSTILSQISAVPRLHGYVAATRKDSAQTILVSDKGDPILAVWQYGLGKAVAWTSDATSRWARDWVAWENFATFWAQAVRFTVSERGTSPLQVRIEARGQETVIRIDAISAQGRYLNNVRFTANIIAPDGSVQTLELPQVAPGQYQVIFKPGQEGAYLLRFDGLEVESGEALSELAGWVRSYSPEYRFLIDDPERLPDLAEQAGGAIVPLDSPAATFIPPPVRSASGLPLWPSLLAAALALLPFDIAVRRLALERRDFARAWGKLRRRMFLQPAPAAAGTARTSRMASLLQAKERAEERRARREELEVEPAVRDTKVESQEKSETQEAGQGGDESSRASTSAALLARKRARKRRE